MDVRSRTVASGCNQRGVILTCFVNGRKRFRAVPTSSDNAVAQPTVGDLPAGTQPTTVIAHKTRIAFDTRSID